MEDNDFEKLGTLMRAVDPPPGNLDVASVVEAGRRGQRRRRFAVATAAAGTTAVVLVGAVSAVAFVHREGGTHVDAAATRPVAKPSATAPATVFSPPADTTCTVQMLPAPAGATYPSATHADPTGRYIAGESKQGPVLWVSGVGHLLSLPRSIRDQGFQTNGVNSRGDVVGFAQTSSGKTTGWLIHDGNAAVLPRLAGFENTDPDAIDRNGDIAGMVWGASGRDVPVIWPADRPGTVHRLATPANASGAEVYAMDSAGTIGGSIGDGKSPFVWDSHGRGRALKVPSGYHGGKVFAVNGDWAAGYVGTPASETSLTAARWNLKTGKVDVFDERYEATSVNPAGGFVGGYNDLGDKSYLYRDGMFHVLTGTDALPRADVKAISDDGKTVIGNVIAPLSDPKGTQRPAIWHC